MKKVFVLLCVLFTSFYSCESDTDDDEIVLIGTWQMVGLHYHDFPYGNINYTPVVDTGNRMRFNTDGTVDFYKNYNMLDTTMDYSFSPGINWMEFEGDNYKVDIGDDIKWGFYSLTDTVFETVQWLQYESFNFYKFRKVNN